MGDRNPPRRLSLHRVIITQGSGDVHGWERERFLFHGQPPEPILRPRHSRPQRHRPGAPFGLPSEGVRPEANEYPHHLRLPRARGFRGQPRGGRQAFQIPQAVNQVVQEPPQGSGQQTSQGSGQQPSQGSGQQPSQGSGRQTGQGSGQGTARASRERGRLAQQTVREPQRGGRRQRREIEYHGAAKEPPKK